jgi:hypothetical protein
MPTQRQSEVIKTVTAMMMSGSSERGTVESFELMIDLS